LRTLARLCQAVAVSGDEREVRKIVQDELKAHADELKVDALGNVLVTKKGTAARRLRVMLDAGKPTPTRQATLSGYNARIGRITPGAGQAATASQTVTFGESGERAFQVEVSHMKPAHPFANDQGLVTFALDEETITISLESLASEGPIWFEDQGVYITNAQDATSFADYQSRIAGQKTVARNVAESREQSLGGASNGQPRPHPVPFHLACQRARLRFWLEPDGDLALVRANVTEVDGRDTARFKNEGDARFFFGLDRFAPKAPAPLVAVGAAIAVSALIGLPALGVATVGEVPRGFPPLTLPSALSKSCRSVSVRSWTDRPWM
jgi:hypothetical protein